MARILVADDSAVIRVFYDNLLESLGHEVILCRNGQEALDKFAVEDVDLMILDVEMPRKSGLEVCREVRQQPRGLAIPIIIVSSCQEEEEILDGLSVGANDYLLKPVKESLLIARLRNLLKTSILHNSDYELVKNQVILAERYKVRKIIGYGRHSIVFMVDDLNENNEKKALKLLNENISDPVLLAEYLGTAENFSKINSEYIVKTLESGQYCGRCYLVMEYISAGDLRELITHRRLSVMEAVHLGYDISTAIHDMEVNGIIHFDIKPENILITEDGHFKLADFGMLTTRDSVTIPMNAEIWSTAAYVSPEYIDAEHDLTSKSDIYSLGVTIFEGIVGDNPFMSDKPMNSLYRQMNIQPPALDSLNEDVPEKLSDLIKVMLVKNPELRPTPEECVDFFSALLDTSNHSWAVRPEIIPKEPELQHRMNRNLSKTNANIDFSKTALSIQKLEEATEKVEESFFSKETSKHKNTIKAVILAVACLFITIYLGTLISSFFIGESSAQSGAELGPMTVLICPKCSNILEKRCKDVTKERCPKCSATMALATKCIKCGKEFAEKEESDAGDGDDHDTGICPACRNNKKQVK
ncbi:MAG: protein kinase [Victivallaceae bacterium]|nr:protein kinase [Victivallaceae bacterium]